MKKIAVIFADGTEEIEAITPIDLLRRCGIGCDVVSVSGQFPVGSHAITIKSDKTVEDVDFSDYDGIVIPGGMPGATNISANAKVLSAVSEMLSCGKLVAAICASPAVVLAENGLVDGRKVTCYPAPDFIGSLKNCIYTGVDVEIDGNLITANGPKSAMSFALAVCSALGFEKVL